MAMSWNDVPVADRLQFLDRFLIPHERRFFRIWLIYTAVVLLAFLWLMAEPPQAKTANLQAVVLKVHYISLIIHGLCVCWGCSQLRKSWVNLRAAERESRVLKNLELET